MRRLVPAATVALLAVLPASVATQTDPVGPAGTAAAPATAAPRAGGAPVEHATGQVVAAPAAADLPDDGDRPITPPPSFDGEPVAPAPAPPKTLQAATFDRRRDGVWAVVVGIDDYPGRGSDLRASVNDADAALAALTAYGVPASRIVVLRDQQASVPIIRASLQWLADRAGPDATAVFFYAGHIRKLDHDTEAIVAADGGLVSDIDVAWDLRRLRAGHTWIALAACYAGGFTEVLAPGRVLTGAADSTSLAYESSRYGRSYLGEFMVERAMRNGMAATSVEQAFAWAQEELRRDHPKRLLVQYDHAAGDVVLGTPPPARQPPAPPTTSPPPSQPPQPQAQPQAPPPAPAEEPKDEDGCLLGIFGDCRTVTRPEESFRH